MAKLDSGGPLGASLSLASSLTWCRLLPFFSVSLVLLRVVLVFFLILLGLMKNSERLGFPIFAVLGKGRPALTNSAFEVEGWLPLLPEVHLPWLTCQMLADVVQRKVLLLVVLMAGVRGS